MSVEQKVAKLEALLARIDRNRRPLESVGSAAIAAAPALPPAQEPTPAQTPEPVPDAPRGAVVSASQHARSQTPMEQALSFELEVDEPEIEIDYGDDDDDGPIITIEPGQPEPEDDLDGVPTAPVGTPAVAKAEPAAPVPAAPAHAAPLPVEPVRLETPVASASTPVAKVVSRAAPRTFSELLDRTLALRPR